MLLISVEYLMEDRTGWFVFVCPSPALFGLVWEWTGALFPSALRSLGIFLICINLQVFVYNDKLYLKWDQELFLIISIYTIG